jgi:general secretion pathway protein G
MSLFTRSDRSFVPRQLIKVQVTERKLASTSGFTLLELLIVLVIIGLLAGLVGPRLLERLDSSKVTTTETQIRMLRTALDTLRLDIGRYPTTDEGLALLSSPPADPEVHARWRGPYLEGALPDDAWGHPYNYAYLGSGNPPFALYSQGDKSSNNGPGKSIGINPPG